MPQMYKTYLMKKNKIRELIFSDLKKYVTGLSTDT